MKRIALHGKYGAGKFALVDDEDFDRVNALRWRGHNRGYACRGSRSCVMMHRLVLQLLLDDAREVDHVDGNKLNNQKLNLRACTHKQNCQNMAGHRNSLLGVRGVYWLPKQRRFRAILNTGGKYVHAGCFATPEEAALAYNAVATKHFGEFARLNKLPLRLRKDPRGAA